MQTGLQPDGPGSYVRLIKAVDRKQFGVHLDVCNAINQPDRYYHNAQLIRDCFEKLGEWVVSCHAKDLLWITDGYNVHFKEVIPGTGVLDYKTYLTELSRLPVDAPLMLEHLKSEAEYDQGRAYVQRVAADAGLAFA
jgi:L-ribulose-5-phosphate 3-epimerase UlaE